MHNWLNWVKQTWHRSRWHQAMLVAPPVALLILSLLWGYGSRGDVQYYTAKVERGSISQVVQATGTINAVVSVQVGSQVSGNIQKLFADFNSRVKNGQVIAQIDPAIFQAKVDQTEADLQDSQANVTSLEAAIETQRGDVLVCKANVDKAQAQLFDAKTQDDRTQQLATQGVVAAQQRDTIMAGHDAAKANLAATQAQYQQSQAKLKSSIAQRDQALAQVKVKAAVAQSSRLDLEHTHIIAPIDGTVIARNVDVGQTVAASLQAPVLFVIAQDLTKMLVYAKTDEADVGRIQVGAEANFRVDSFPRETFYGHVQQVRMNAYTVQNVVTYDTIIEFDNPDMKLFPGMTAYVTIPTAVANDAVKIPNGALRFKPDLSDSEQKALLAKYNIADDPQGAGGRGPSGATDPSAQRNGAGAAAGNGGPDGAAGGSRGGAGGGRGRGGGGAGGPGRAGGAGGPGGGGRASATREDTAVVWKLLPDGSLQPARARLGVTDFTFTAMSQGDLKVGDDLVIGQASSKATVTAQPGGQRPPLGPGGGPGGPGGLRRF